MVQTPPQKKTFGGAGGGSSGLKAKDWVMSWTERIETLTILQNWRDSTLNNPRVYVLYFERSTRYAFQHNQLNFVVSHIFCSKLFCSGC